MNSVRFKIWGEILMILTSLYPLIGIFIALSILLTIFKLFKPTLKGKIGEFAVHLHVKLYLNQEQYILLNDCTLPDGLGGTTQIDHILLSPYGIFVIETKNYKGWIFGSARQKMWTQKRYKQSYLF